MSIFEYDEEKHMEMERRESREEGVKIGCESVRIEKIQKKVERGLKVEDIAEQLEEPLEYTKRVCELLAEHPKCSARELLAYMEAALTCLQ